MIELKISADAPDQLVFAIQHLAGALGGGLGVSIASSAAAEAARSDAAPAVSDTTAPLPPAEDMRPVRGENAKALAAQIVAGALPTTHIARLPKALQDEVRAALTEREPSVMEADDEPSLPLIRTSPENREPPVEAVVVSPPPARKPWEKDAYEVGDVRAALQAYAEKFGMPAAMENGPTMIRAAKVSDLKPEQFGHAVAAIMAEIEAA